MEDLLQDHLRRRQAAETDLPAPLPPRSNKRLRDYLLLAIAGNLLALLGFVFLPINPVVFVYLVAFVALYNTSLPWVMFVVMDRY